MKIRYKDNLTAGILSIIFGIVLYLLIPIQIKAEASSTYGITSRSIPYALSVLVMICGAGLIIQSLLLKNDEVKELEVGKELKGFLYMMLLLGYGIGVSKNFMVSTIILGTATLAFVRCRKPLYYGIAAAVVVLIYYIFTQLLHVRLP